MSEQQQPYRSSGDNKPGYQSRGGGQALRGRRGGGGNQRGGNQGNRGGNNYVQRTSDRQQQQDQPSTYGVKEPKLQYQKPPQVDPGNRTAEQQFDALFGGAGDDAISLPPAVPVVDDAKPRIKFTKKQLLEKFVLTKELDFTVFEKEHLLQNADIFHSATDGSGKLPEALLEEGGDDKTPVQAAFLARKGNPNKKPLVKGQRGPTTYEEECDEPDPEWLDQDPEADEAAGADEGAFFNRVIPDEQEIRARVSQTVVPISAEDQEDALDEMIQSQMKELESSAAGV